MEKPGSPSRPSTFALFPGRFGSPPFCWVNGEGWRFFIVDLFDVFFVQKALETQKTDEDWICLNFLVVS